MKKIKFEYFMPLIVVLLFAVIIAGLEWGLRVRRPDLILRFADEPSTHSVFDNRIGRWHRKNFYFDGATHNKKGIRDKDVPYENKNRRRRILFLGDSVTWGYRVEDGKTFSDFLENKVPNTDMINMGALGYGNGEELLLLKYEGLRYQPDIVVLVLCISNDVKNNLSPEGQSSFPANYFYLEDQKLKIKTFHVNFARRAAMWLNEYSYVINFLHEVSQKISGKLSGKVTLEDNDAPWKRYNWVAQMNQENFNSLHIDYSPYEHLTYLDTGKELPEIRFDEYETDLLRPTARNYYGVELTKAILLEVRNLVEANNAEFFVVLTPFVSQFEYPEYYNYLLNKELMRFFKDNGIEAVDLLPVFVEKGFGAGDIFIDFCHFSVSGHKIVADILYDEFVKRQWVSVGPEL